MTMEAARALTEFYRFHDAHSITDNTKKSRQDADAWWSSLCLYSLLQHIGKCVGDFLLTLIELFARC